MWTKSHTITTTAVSKEQIWRLFEDVNHWHTWDTGIEFARIQGKFDKGNHFILKPKGGPEVKIVLLETEPFRRFLDVTAFPLAKMYDDHLFEETPNGLKITHTISVKGPLSFLWIKLVAQGLADSLAADMEKQVRAASVY